MADGPIVRPVVFSGERVRGEECTLLGEGIEQCLTSYLRPPPVSMSPPPLAVGPPFASLSSAPL